MHTEKSLKPEDYTVERYIYVKQPQYLGNMGAFEAEMRFHRELVDYYREQGLHRHGGVSNCDHCGAWFHHGALVRHKNGDLLSIGWQCAGRFDLSNIAWQKIRQEKVNKTVRVRRGRYSKMRVFVEANSEAVRILNLNKQLGRDSNDFLASLRTQICKWIELSDRQFDAIEPAWNKHQTRQVEREEEMTAPVVEGRVQITGTVLGTKRHDSMYGETLKMLVKDDRHFKVWGTVPRALLDAVEDDLKGSRVIFVATVEQSRDDETFGFFTRPIKAEIRRENDDY
tara:strand:- start:282 stop:1130 length:849 start_codon:yes stop_codon:yes gene_type:complete